MKIEAGELDLKIIDFGRTSTFHENWHAGSPMFMSPKAVNLRKNIGPELRKKNDLYGLGMCIVGLFGTSEEIMNKIKVDGKTLSELKSFIKVQAAFNKSSRLQAADIAEIEMPAQVRGIVEKLIEPESLIDAEALIELINRHIQGLRQSDAAH